MIFGANLEMRAFRWDDLPVVVDIVNRSDAYDGLERGASESELRAWWTDPNIAPEQNGFLALVDGEPVGYGLVPKRPEVDYSSFSEFFVNGAVLPEWRHQSIGRRIVGECERRAWMRLDEASIPTVTMMMWVEVRQTDTALLCSDLGMAPARSFFNMVYDSPASPRTAPCPSGYRIREASGRREIADAFGVLATAFQDHWGHPTLSLQEWRHWMPGADGCADQVYVGLDRAGRIVGACRCAINPEQNRRLGRAQGWIEDLGVLCDHRSRGLGRALLLAGIDGLRKTGCTHVLLDVDVQNTSGALRLYESLGFRVRQEIVVWRKFLRG